MCVSVFGGKLLLFFIQRLQTFLFVVAIFPFLNVFFILGGNDFSIYASQNATACFLRCPPAPATV